MKVVRAVTMFDRDPMTYGAISLTLAIALIVMILIGRRVKDRMIYTSYIVLSIMALLNLGAMIISLIRGN